MFCLHIVFYQWEIFVLYGFHLDSKGRGWSICTSGVVTSLPLPLFLLLGNSLMFFFICYVSFSFGEISMAKPSCICTTPCVTIGHLTTSLVLSPGKCCASVGLWDLVSVLFAVVHSLISIWHKNRDCFTVLGPLHIHLLLLFLLFPTVQLRHGPYNSLIQISVVAALFSTCKAF